MWINRVLFFILLFCSAFFGILNATELQKKGSLVVSFQTNEVGERLDRIRFLLKDDKQQEQMYPRGNSYVEEAVGPKRLVVLEDLNPGHYTLEFVIPNVDGFFEDVPIRDVMIEEGKILKVDQYIKPKSNPGVGFK